MNDNELINAIAEKVMGWVEHDSGIWYMPDESRDNRYGMGVDEWNPITNANHWMMVVERMREKGFTLKLGHGLTVGGVLTWARFESNSWDIYHRDEVPGRAILKAALKAVENE